MQYETLSLADKRTTVLGMLKDLVNKHESFAQLYTMLGSANYFAESLYDGIYANIISLAQAIKAGRADKQLDAFAKNQRIIQQIQKREALETQDENPDALLDQLDGW